MRMYTDAGLPEYLLRDEGYIPNSHVQAHIYVKQQDIHLN